MRKLFALGLVVLPAVSAFGAAQLTGVAGADHSSGALSSFNYSKVVTPGVQPTSVVYDYTGSGPGLALNQPRPVDNGDFGTMTLPALGPSEAYQIDSITVARVSGTVSGASVDIGALLWDNVAAPPAGTSVFSGFLGGGIFNRVTAAANSVSTTTITFLPGSVLTTDTTIGIQMIYAAPTTISVVGDTVNYTPTTSGMGAFFEDHGPDPDGLSSNGFFIDTDGDKLLESTEFTGFAAPNDVKSNVFLSISASVIAVPEPATIGTLGIAGLAMLTRRRAK